MPRMIPATMLSSNAITRVSAAAEMTKLEKVSPIPETLITPTTIPAQAVAAAIGKALRAPLSSAPRVFSSVT